jgi:hypothetical protein
VARVKRVVLLGHIPSEEVKESLKTLLGNDITIVAYNFHVDQMQNLHKAIVGLVMNLEALCGLQGADEIIMCPPGLSSAAFLLSDAIRGLTGKPPKLLNMTKASGGGNRYLPCPEAPIIDNDRLFSYMRKKRTLGVLYTG